MRSLILLTATLTLLGCSAAGSTTVNDCDPNEGLQVDSDGNIIEGITQCAICRRYEDAYDARAAELGCTELFPLDGCPIDEGVGNCQVDLVVGATDWMDTLDCEALLLYVGSRESYGGHECGTSCTWTNPYADPTVTSTVVEEWTSPYKTDWDDQHACCPGTSYAERATNISTWDCQR